MNITDWNTYKEPKTLIEVFKEFESLSLDDEFKSLDSNPIDENYPIPSELRISTMTATCKTNLSVNLNAIYKYSVIQDIKSDKEGIIKVEYGDEIVRGKSKKDLENKKVKIKKVFYNQATIIFKLISGKVKKEVNMKIFTNGNIQMTGLKNIEDGKKAVQMFYDETKNLQGLITHKETCEIKTIKGIDNPETFSIKDFEIVLINSDYSTRFKIKRDVLHSILVKQYKLFSSYEPCIYPGVNSKYFWNLDYKNKSGLKEGICHCTANCTGKGKGDGNGKCKKITISIFQSGNIIITGARSLEQIKDAYIFINKVLKTNFDVLKRENIPLLDISSCETGEEEEGLEKSIMEIKGKNTFVYLKKSNIKLDNKIYKNNIVNY